MADKDISSEVQAGFNDEEFLPLTKCKCGQTFDMWNFVLCLGREDAIECPSCGRALYFTLKITVWEVDDA